MMVSLPAPPPCPLSSLLIFSSFVRSPLSALLLLSPPATLCSLLLLLL